MKGMEVGFSIGSSSAPMNDVDLVSSADMKLFNTEMYTPPVEEQSVADKVIDKFSDMSEGMALKKDDFEMKLSKASETGNAADALAATRAMSEYYLQAAISTKVASKATQAIDKITSLQ
jgi:hypothetical protein